MPVFSNPYYNSHEDVIFCSDADTGLRAIIAIHNTLRGPALGGCRFWPYLNEDEALKDVLRLSRGMTYKAALANLDFGGGKSVIIGDPKKIKDPQLLQAFGRRVQQLHGTYITAPDIGTSTDDMDQIKSTTSHVVGLNKQFGGSGDPSVVTSYGVFIGIKACLKFATGSAELSGRKIAIQGMGSVGLKLANRLFEAGAQLIITDVNAGNIAAALEEVKAVVVTPDEIFDVDADVFAPCALGGVINDQTIKRFKFKIIAGAANNQLADSHHAEVLMEHGIVYAPDYVINSGGLINVSYEGPSYNYDIVISHVAKLYDTLLEIMEIAKLEGISTRMASDSIAEERLR